MSQNESHGKIRRGRPRKGAEQRFQRERAQTNAAINALFKFFRVRTDAEFAALIGTTPLTVQKWRRSETLTSFAINRLESIGINPDFLRTGKGDVLKTDTEAKKERDLVQQGENAILAAFVNALSPDLKRDVLVYAEKILSNRSEKTT